MRIAAFFALFLSVFLMPWPVVVAVFALSVAIFPKFFEGLLAAVFMDAYYFSIPLFDKWHVGFFTVIFVASFVLMEWISHVIQGRNFLSKLIVAGSGAVFLTTIILIFS